MSVNNCSLNGCRIGGYVYVDEGKIVVTPLANRSWKRVGAFMRHGAELFVNTFHIINGLFRSSGRGGIGWGTAVFKVLDRTRICAVILIPIHLKKIIVLAKNNDPLDKKLCKMASSVSQVYHSTIMGIWALAGWFSKLDKAMPWLTALWGIGCVFRLGEIAHSRWEKRMVDQMRERVNKPVEDFTLNAFTNEDLIDFFQVPEENVRTLREDAKQESVERVKEYLHAKLDRKEKQLKLATISSTVSFISGVLLLGAMVTPLGPLATVVYGTAYGLFVVAGVTGLMEWREETKTEKFRLKGNSVELQELKPSQEDAVDGAPA